MRPRTFRRALIVWGWEAETAFGAIVA